MAIILCKQMHVPTLIEIPKFLPQSPWHPSVVYIPDDWNGHPYWMAETPLPIKTIFPYLDRWELPCIHYSDDGINWRSINANPIDDLSESQIKGRGYHSDPHLIFKDGVLYCYYRLMEDHDTWTTIIRKHSVDGTHWSEREVVCRVRSSKRQIISPAIVWTGKCFRMYYVDDTFTNIHRGVQYCESIDGLTFNAINKVVLVTFNNKESTIPWHIDVQKIGELYYMVVHDVNNNKLELWKSEDGISFIFACNALRPSNKVMSFYRSQLYRSCLVSINNVLRIYFSAHNNRSRHIGLLESRDNGIHFEISSCSKNEHRLRFIGQMIYEECVSLYHNCIRFLKHKL